ncbi:nucleotidyltransferase [Bacteroidia bacterium]|nr:nucleotidyltransferase [Bacteroidia bacterium]
MVKATVNLDKTTVLKVIKDLHKTLKRHGIADNHIALFGSFQNGNTHEDSDIDVIVISPVFEGKNMFERVDMTAKAQIDVKRRFVVPMDILLKTPKEYDYSKKAYFNSKIII